ncbi:hypothetical protein [uncultured Roseobacter sp.]|uniref:hypothetical protein n=1 Tax=uncultured Roseobacter sp. TaxID=114847 RepID=UPI0026124CDC|nr:hypothetical protein [uncultured Roseobacter sp.]
MTRSSIRFFALAAVLSLSACAEVISERTSTIQHERDTLTVRTQTLQVGERVYDVSRVEWRNRSQRCLVDSPGSCQAAASELKNDARLGGR